MEAASQQLGTTVAELRRGQRFEGRYACARKDRLTARTGSSYLSLELRDRTGSIPARVFRDADRIAMRFEAGDPVAVSGRVGTYRGEAVAELDDVRRLEPAEAEPEQFLPAAYRSVEELEGFLEHLVREIHDPGLRAVAENLVLSGPLAADFRRAPCTRGGHHAYLGGLIEHTVAVATLVGETCILHPRLDSDLLMCAAIVHDIGKTREFTYGARFEISEEGRLLGHLQLGAVMIGEVAGGLPESRRLALLNCVLSHHGVEAPAGRSGPGRGFASAEALALQRLNALDAGVKAVLEHGL